MRYYPHKKCGRAVPADKRGDVTPSVEKVIEKMRSQPHGIQFSEAERVLAAYGYAFERQKGSHRRYGNGRDHITLPRQNPLKAAYVAAILDIIKEDGT
jgi:predicted RNA binding protein YcfA (HicA-like mRNA interferase family)